jgi:hypothetical protein
MKTMVSFMKTWKQVELEYAQYLEKIKLKYPHRRISALHKIEECLKATYPSLLKGYALFTQIDKKELKERFRNWKGKNLNGPESQVINDFYKLAKLSVQAD